MLLPHGSLFEVAVEQAASVWLTQRSRAGDVLDGNRKVRFQLQVLHLPQVTRPGFWGGYVAVRFAPFIRYKLKTSLPRR